MNKYNQLFKQQVVNFYFEHHENLAFTLKHFNLAAKSVRCWIAQYKYSGTHGLAVLHHKKQNQGLPSNLLCRRRKRASGQIVEYFYYVLANGKEKSLGSDKYHAVLEAPSSTWHPTKFLKSCYLLMSLNSMNWKLCPQKAHNLLITPLLNGFADFSVIHLLP